MLNFKLLEEIALLESLFAYPVRTAIAGTLLSKAFSFFVTKPVPTACDKSPMVVFLGRNPL